MRLFNTLTISLLLALTSICAQNDISFRLSAEAYTIEDNKTTVAIQVKADEAEMNLADQYYRFYYDAANMELNDFNIITNLPGELYYDAQVVEHVNGFDASRIGALDYDKNLGFVNLFIELSDLSTGGVSINPADGWVTVATVEFEIANAARPIYATWAREAVTKDYASAFSIVSEWVQPQVVEVATDNIYNDLYAVAKKNNNSDQVEIKIGPNPTADFVKIRNAHSFDNDAIVTLRDLNGSLLQTQDIAGTTEATINLNNYESGAYIVEIANGDNTEVITEKIIFTRS